MLIERPPRLFRLFYPGAIFRAEGCGRRVYLTFDDGPVPGATPYVLDVLRSRNIKATFFMVGDNVARYPELYHRVIEEGHQPGNHTMHHRQGILSLTRRYLADVENAAVYIQSRLLRPPHGVLRIGQWLALSKKYRFVMYDLVTRDYSRLMTSADVVNNVRRLTRPGSIIVFHDSVKSLPRMRDALPAALDWLIDNGYEFGLIGDEYTR